MKSFRTLFWLAAILVVTPLPAHAYIDPGTAGMILQLLVGGIAGAVVIFRHRLHRVKTFFTRGGKQDTKPTPPDGTDDADKPGL